MSATRRASPTGRMPPGEHQPGAEDRLLHIVGGGDRHRRRVAHRAADEHRIARRLVDVHRDPWLAVDRRELGGQLAGDFLRRAVRGLDAADERIVDAAVVEHGVQRQFVDGGDVERRQGRHLTGVADDPQGVPDAHPLHRRR